MNIMIVDDEPKIRNGLTRLISAHEGWVCRAFSDAEASLDYMYNNVVDAIITDIQMSGLSGLDMIEKVRALNPEIPVIIISGYSRFDYAQRAIELGVRKYITKPTNPEEIISSLAQIEKELDDQLSDIRSRLGGRQPKHIGNLVIMRAIEYIDQHYGEKLTLARVAGAMYISPNYFSELFRKTTDVRFSDYLFDLRMEKSLAFLADVGYKITDISALVGFNNARYFSSSFKRKYGVTPMEYRNGLLATPPDGSHS